MKKITAFLIVICGFFLFAKPGIAFGADLIPTNFVLTDESGVAKNTFNVGENIYVKVTISNPETGSPTPADGDDHTYEGIYKNKDAITSCNTQPDLTLTNGLYGSGTSYDYESRPDGTKSSQFNNGGTWTMSAPGSYKAWIYIDYNCRITESNQNNNLAPASYTVVDPNQAPPASDTTLQNTSTLPTQGSWIIDPEVTKIGKNASRSGMLLDWTLRDYQWSFVKSGDANPLVPFWLTIQRIVYSLFLFVILVTAFILIVTRGRSLSAKRFLPRFFLVVLLVTFSFSLVQFLYQIIDIFQGFFLKNPQGSIISSKDLLYIGFDYRYFQGLRLFGQSYDESAFISLLFVKLTAFTYYVMAILLIFRKIILWFFIVLSPVFPILLLFYPLRNTAKIWIGEFFRWLLYAPLFAIFLSGLVKLWQTSLPLLWDYTKVGKVSETVYPTAVNILLGGPGQHIGLNNSVNLPDTFALYLVALIMLWAAILLPFILLQIFLDYMMAFNYKDSPLAKQVYTMLNNRPALPPPNPIVPITPTQPAGLARSLPFGRRFAIPRGTGLAKELPTSVGAGQTINRPTSTSQNISRPIITKTNAQTEISRLTNLSIPTMRDIARFETMNLSSDTRTRQEIARVKETLSQIANPASTTSSTQRDRYQMIRERLVTERQKGNQVATTVLNAATTYNTYSQQSSITSSSQASQQFIQNLASPERIVEKSEKEKVTLIKEQLQSAVKEGNQVAKEILNSINTVSSSQTSQLQQLLTQVSHPEKVTDTTEKQNYVSLREKIIQASKSGNQLASVIASSLEKSTSKEEVRSIQDQILKAQAEGNPLASEIMRVMSSTDKTSEKQVAELKTKLQEASKKGEPLATSLLQMLESKERQTKTQSIPVAATDKLKTGAFPVVNRIQQVSLDDYESVKKMWQENYQNLDVPANQAGQRTRKEWISQEVSDIDEIVSLLSSTNAEDVEKGMQQVSDILPFLLIGGFSQTEIVAYLKAKQEAGKAVLETMSSKDEEEETLLTAERAAKAATAGHLTMAESISDTSSNDSDTSSVINNITNNISHITTTQTSIQTPQTSVQTTNVSNKVDSSLLNLASLPVIRMQDIVRYELSTRTQSDKERVEREKIQTILKGIGRPDSVQSQQEKEQYTRLREQILKENQKGNPLAAMILSATEQVDQTASTLTQKESLPFAQTLLGVVSPSLMSDKQLAGDVTSINKQFTASREQADSLSLAILAVVDKVNEIQSEKTKDFLQKISNPNALATAPEQMHYNKLVERIAQASADGNETAAFILKIARDGASDTNVTKLYSVLSQASQNGDTLAEYVSSTLYSLPSDVSTSITNLYQQLVNEKKSGNALAAAILRLFAKQQRQSTTHEAGVVSLPRQNRLQQVTIQDYETVKKMWSENYRSAETPTSSTNQPLSRQEWLKDDITSITETMSLLSSSNAQDNEKGMERVGELLPFLLLGGFSSSEILGYLQAKQEAAKSVLEEITKTTSEEDEELTTRSVSSKSSRMVQSEEIPEEPESPASAGSTQPQQSVKISPANVEVSQGEPLVVSNLVSQLRIPLPSLRDIASFETNQQASSQSTITKLRTIFKQLSDPSSIASPEDRERITKLRTLLTQQANAGDTTAESILAATGSHGENTSETDGQVLLKTLRFVLDPSLVIDGTDKATFSSAREALVQARQAGSDQAISIMKMVDDVSRKEAESVMKLMQYVDNPQLLVDEKEKMRYQALRDLLEKQAPTNQFAATLLSTAHGDITPVSANKTRVQLFEEEAKQNPLARTILSTYLSLPQSTLTEINNFYQQLQKSSSDPLVGQLLRLMAQQKKKAQSVGAVAFPKKNKIQRVTVDDYESVKQMLYDRYLHADVPLTADGKPQSREEWITAERQEVEEVINLLSSDDPANSKAGMDKVGSILPFLLIGGFSKEEVIEYLKAKREAATMALQTLAANEDNTEKVERSTQATQANTATQALDLDEKAETT